MTNVALCSEEASFAELRRKTKESELLSGSTQKLLMAVRFTGRLCVVVKDGHILKSGYEEGYFTRRLDQRAVP